jgi:26S proteasome regulatory subunit N13
MSYDGKKVKPERRKGLIRVTKDMQGMIQFSFLDAETKNKIDNFYVFPGDAKFEKVKQTPDRVYLLEFASTKQRFFYWMQEEEKEKDAENCRKVHCHINAMPLDQQPAA